MRIIHILHIINNHVSDSKDIKELYLVSVAVVWLTIDMQESLLDE